MKLELHKDSNMLIKLSSRPCAHKNYNQYGVHLNLCAPFGK